MKDLPLYKTNFKFVILEIYQRSRGSAPLLWHPGMYRDWMEFCNYFNVFFL